MSTESTRLLNRVKAAAARSPRSIYALLAPQRDRLLVVAAIMAVLVAVNLGWPALRAYLETLGRIQTGLLASLVAGLFTAVGALPILFMRSLSRAREDTLMGFGAGVMLAATAFELVLPAVEQADALFGSPGVSFAILATGIGLGGAAIFALHRLVPHEHFISGPESGADPDRIRRVWLFIFAIALHNMPEGLAVGAGFGGDNLSGGVALAIGIGLQNMPEGLVVAVALLALGHSRWTALGVSLLTGLVQPVGGLIGIVMVSVVDLLLPLVLAFAAGAMLFVISHEIIPESHRQGHQSQATFGVLTGFVVMIGISMVLD